jgi:hypothetical protein
MAIVPSGVSVPAQSKELDNTTTTSLRYSLSSGGYIGRPRDSNKLYARRW